MASIDDEIDDLYRGPLGGFTSARNALAKRAGAQKSLVMALEKPAAGAWAVNQLYWHERRLFDALARASDARRRAHVQRMEGASTSLAAIDGRYHEALEAAKAETLSRARASGMAVTAATEAAIAQTLEAIPTPAIAGRLTAPVQPLGFSMLASLVASTPRPTSTRAPADVIHIGRPSSRHATTPTVPDAPRLTPAQVRQAADEARRAEDARRAARRDAQRALKAAEARERRATETLDSARNAVRKADQLIERLDAQLRDARAAAESQRDAVDRARAAVNDAAAVRIAADRHLRTLD